MRRSHGQTMPSIDEFLRSGSPSTPNITITNCWCTASMNQRHVQEFLESTDRFRECKAYLIKMNLMIDRFVISSHLSPLLPLHLSRWCSLQLNFTVKRDRRRGEWSRAAKKNLSIISILVVVVIYSYTQSLDTPSDTFWICHSV